MNGNDFHNGFKIARGLSPVSNTGDTPSVSQIIDRAGFEGVEFLIATGSLADANATFTVLVEEGDAANLSDAAAVVDADLLGTESGASFQYDDDDEVRKICYKGSKRYCRCTITPSGNSGAALLCIIALLFGPKKLPQSSQS
jgi:hypothetical protein